MTVGFLDLNEDVLRAITEAAALVHRPHWGFAGCHPTHDWVPPALSKSKADLDEDFYPDKRFCLGWIYLSHVNRRLRAVVLDCPALWASSTLALPSRDSDEEILSRSRKMPLQIRIPAERWRTRDDRRRAIRARAPFASMVMGDADIIDVREYSGLNWMNLFDEHPTLRHLALDQRDSTRIRMDINAPNLVSLVLHGAIPVFPTALSSLRELDIRGCHEVPSVPCEPCGVTLLRALDRTPVLERLILVLDSIHNLAPGHNGNVPKLPISLPYVREASIRFTGKGTRHSSLVNPWTYVKAPDCAAVSLVYGTQMVDWASVLPTTAHQLFSNVHDRVSLTVAKRIIVSANHGESERGHLGVRFQQDASLTSYELIALLPTYLQVESIKSAHLILKDRTCHFHVRSTLRHCLAALTGVSTITMETGSDTIEQMCGLLDEITLTGCNLPSLHTLDIRVSRDNEKAIEARNVPLLWQATISLLTSSAERHNTRVSRLILSGNWQIGGEDQEALGLVDAEMKKFAIACVGEVVDARDG
ncbi:unnamed protein product [Peniophora sp. CBMAI 1063]|nr:unnamed protein product [Peniophora sp. CBMAI 1063]